MLNRLVVLFGAILISAKAAEYGSDDLLKAANRRISQEFIMTHPFWTETMIPVAVCLAVVLLIVSIFAVSLIAIKALNEPEPAFVTFAPPGFDALWERNVQAELGVNFSRRPSLETIKEETDDDNKEEDEEDGCDLKVPSVKPNIKFPEIPEMKLKGPIPNMPMEPPKPELATNSKNGLDINKIIS